MATEVRTITDTWCDVHLLDAGVRVASEWSGDIAINELVRHLDLCAECQTRLLGELPEALEQYGQKPDPKAGGNAASGEHICPACNGAYLSRASLVSHARQMHHEVLSVLEMRAGLAPSRKPPEKQRCEVCGQTFRGRQGLASHQRSAHPPTGASAELPLADVS